MTPAGTSNELDVQNEWEENTHTHRRRNITWQVTLSTILTAAQDEREWRRTAEQGAEHFMVEGIPAEKAKAGLRHTVVCPNVTGRIKERIAQSKRARAGSLALVD